MAKTVFKTLKETVERTRAAQFEPLVGELAGAEAETVAFKGPAAIEQLIEWLS